MVGTVPALYLFHLSESDTRITLIRHIGGFHHRTDGLQVCCRTQGGGYTGRRTKKSMDRTEAQKKGNNILFSRLARRNTLAEQPGMSHLKTGCASEDSSELERFSPAVNTVSRNVTLQMAIKVGMTISTGGLKSAFAQVIL